MLPVNLTVNVRRFYNSVGTRRHIHTTSISHYTALHDMIPPLPLGKSESSWLHQSIVARALADAPPNTFWERSHLLLSQMRQASIGRNKCILRCGHHLPLRSYANRLRPEVDPDCRWCGEGPEIVSHIFPECPQLAVEHTDAGVSNPRDLWAVPAEALGFVMAIRLVLGLG